MLGASLLSEHASYCYLLARDAIIGILMRKRLAAYVRTWLVMRHRSIDPQRIGSLLFLAEETLASGGQ